MYRDGRYDIALLDAAAAAAGPVVTPAASAAGPRPPAGALARLLADPRAGLPEASAFALVRYDDRLRLESEPGFGGLVFADLRVDARRYFMPLRPVTIAVRAEHVGRYGPGAGDRRLTPLIVALQSRVRGYDLRTFAADECGRSTTTCSPLDELTGGRLALLNVEVRAPLLGLFSGDLHYGRLPIEAFAFVDAGYLWTRRAGAPLERDRFRSLGAGGRVNIGGFILELAVVRPFDRVGKGWTASLLLRPGF